MNYAQARQREDGSGLWDWTTIINGEIRRSRPCKAECEHQTADNAAQHWYEYSLDSAVMWGIGTLATPGVTDVGVTPTSSKKGSSPVRGR